MCIKFCQGTFHLHILECVAHLTELFLSLFSLYLFISRKYIERLRQIQKYLFCSLLFYTASVTHFLKKNWCLEFFLILKAIFYGVIYLYLQFGIWFNLPPPLLNTSPYMSCFHHLLSFCIENQVFFIDTPFLMPGTIIFSVKIIIKITAF